MVFRREISYDPLTAVKREYSLQMHVDSWFCVVPSKYVNSQSRLSNWKASPPSYARRLIARWRRLDGFPHLAYLPHHKFASAGNVRERVVIALEYVVAIDIKTWSLIHGITTTRQ